MLKLPSICSYIAVYHGKFGPLFWIGGKFSGSAFLSSRSCILVVRERVLEFGEMYLGGLFLCNSLVYLDNEEWGHFQQWFNTGMGGYGSYLKTRVAMWMKAKFDIKVHTVEDFKGYLDGIRKMKL
ncbi:hypothetical protein RHMOL_Rhmol06G0186800 [Rhododendron molle]|uniref:Uncharacterized protein n=1 Tax=Rhododendron molle TaxID=49168 RepID=A0ACC0NF13_RHOML|nr:hypothetical protein RHMOL_Rhmol06G0186800 [Rhododendron molle]